MNLLSPHHLLKYGHVHRPHFGTAGLHSPRLLSVVVTPCPPVPETVFTAASVWSGSPMEVFWVLGSSLAGATLIFNKSKVVLFLRVGSNGTVPWVMGP